MTHLDFSHYKTRPEPDEPYFEDALAGEANVPVGRKLTNVIGAVAILLVTGIVVLAMLLWKSRN